MWSVLVIFPLAWAAPPKEPATLPPIRPSSTPPPIKPFTTSPVTSSTQSTANISSKAPPPVAALYAQPKHTVLLAPLTTKKRFRKLSPLPVIEFTETWPPPPPRPLEAQPPTVARPPMPPPEPPKDSDDIDTRSPQRKELDKRNKKKKKKEKRTKKIQKLAKYVKKNKKLLKQLLEVKNERSKERIHKVLKSLKKWKGRGKASKKGGRVDRVLRSWGDRPHMRESKSGDDDDDLSSLPAEENKRFEEKKIVHHDEQFDLIFARGSQISNMRVKGRICQRSILNAEGPKYKRSGVSYRGEFVTDKHEFRHTHKPSFILPRCCNCCKKSVLGCE